MTEQAAQLAPPPLALSWSEAMILAVAHPSRKSFERLASDPGASTWRPYRWVYLAAFISSLFTMLIDAINGQGQLSVWMALEALRPALYRAFIFFLVVGIAHLLARRLGGTGTYEQLAFSVGAFYAPLQLVDIPIEVVALLSASAAAVLAVAQVVLSALYVSALTVLAVEAAHQLTWRRAVLASASVLLLQGLGVALLAVMMTVMMLPGGQERIAKVLFGSTPTELFESAEMPVLEDALYEQYIEDDTILAMSWGIDVRWQTRGSGLWLWLDIASTRDCTETRVDMGVYDSPCDRLASETVRTVLNYFDRLDELAGIAVAIGNEPFEDYMDPADIKLERARTIEEWQARVGY